MGARCFLVTELQHRLAPNTVRLRSHKLAALSRILISSFTPFVSHVLTPPHLTLVVVGHLKPDTPSVDKRSRRCSLKSSFAFRPRAQQGPPVRPESTTIPR